MPNCSLLSKSLLSATRTHSWQPNGLLYYAPHFWNISGYRHNFEITSFACNPNPLNASCCFNCVGRLRNEQEVVQVGQVQPIGGDHYQTADPPETRLYSGRQNGHPSAPLNDSDGRRARLRTSGGSVSLEMHILPGVQPSTLWHPPSPTSPLSPTIDWEGTKFYNPIFTLLLQI